MANVGDNLRTLAGWVIPYRLGVMIRLREHRRMLSTMKKAAEAANAGVSPQEQAMSGAGGRSYTREDVMDYLGSQGFDLQQVSEGSVPDQSLKFCCNAIEDRLPSRPLRGLHIGNFVGLSLCHFTDFVRQLDERGTIVSIDPNLPHRGIHQPMDIVIRCLVRYGLQGNSLILTGYSLEKTFSNDGRTTIVYDARAEFSKEYSCENQLPLLATYMPASFDFAFIDGNHDDEYLSREIEVIDRLLKPQGMLILDDIDWDEVGGHIGEVYRSIDRERFEQLGGDGRVGLLRKRA